MTILENRALLQKLANSMVKDSSVESESVCLALLKALIPIGRFMLRQSLRSAFDGTASSVGRLAFDGSRPVTPTFVESGDVDSKDAAAASSSGVICPAATTAQTAGAGGFPQLMVTMATLAGAGRSGKGHATLFKAALEWTNLCRSCFGRRDLAAVIRGGDDDDEEFFEVATDAALAESDEKSRLQPMPSTAASKSCLESICFLLSYVGEILGALKLTNASKTDSDTDHQHDWTMGAAPGIDPDLYYYLEGILK